MVRITFILLFQAERNVLCVPIPVSLMTSQLTALLSSFLPDPSENMREILQNVAKQQGVSNMRKLGHLNNFIKVCHLKSGSVVSVEQGMLG